MKIQISIVAIAASVFLLLTALILGRGQFSVSIEPAVAPIDPLPHDLPDSTPTTATLASLEPAPTLSAAIAKRNAPQTMAQPPAGAIGGLRVSNQSEYPLRLALLPKQSRRKSSQPSGYSQTVHWDFAPQEGSNRGLLLSRPDGNLKLSQGDILVAFAQDGSRRYWGPYVVGETSLPIWNRQKSEWELILPH